MKELLLGVAIAYIGFHPDGQRKAKEIAEILLKRYKNDSGGVEHTDKEK